MVSLIKDKKGCLMPFNLSDIPFEVKRIFVINKVPKRSIRGNHAHKENLQYLICTSGTILVTCVYGKKMNCIFLQKGDTFLLKNMVYASQQYMETNSELMVLCSHEYDKNDYITDFEEFKKLTQ